MDVLLIKTSSMGDIVHTFPALTDAVRAMPDIRFHWVVEEAFGDLAARHPAVTEVIPVAIRRWRQHPLRYFKEWQAFKQRLKADRYDAVIDAQGLIKSAFLTRLAQGPKFGLDKASAREPLAARVLDHPLAVPKGQHAIERTRQLLAQALGYSLTGGLPDYGIAGLANARPLGGGSQLIFFHGTTWPSKHWPESYWRQLTELANTAGMKVLLPWGTDAEKSAAERIAAGHANATVLPRLSLSALFDLLRTLDGFVAVDTGLAHLAAATGLAGVALYGPTDPALTGVIGKRARSLAAVFPCAPCKQANCTYKGGTEDGTTPACFSRLPPSLVWQALLAQAEQSA